MGSLVHLRVFIRQRTCDWSLSVLLTAFLIVSLYSPAQAVVVQFDFNDNTAGSLGGQGGGIGSDSTTWLSNAATHSVVAGDLVAPASTNFTRTQTAGTAHSVSNDGASFEVGQLARDLETPLTGTVWFSYLADVDDSGTRVGLGFNNLNTSTGNPRLLMLNDQIRFIGNTGDTGGLGGGFTTQTNLVLGRIDLDVSGTSDELSVWVNPNVNGLGAPVFTQSLGDEFGSSITAVNIQSYNTNSGAFDFLTLSDGPNAFTDVTGAVLVTAAEWNVSGGGDWGTGTNWTTSPDVPDGLDITFGSSITGPATVTLDQDRAVDDLTFNNSNSYTLAANTLTVTNTVTTQQGSHTISSALELAGGTRTLTSDSGASLNVTGTTTTQSDTAATLVLDGAGNGSLAAIRDNNDVANALDGTDNVTVVKRGAGTWTIGTGTTTLEDFHGGDTIVEAGTLKVKADTIGGTNGELRSPTVDVRSGATFDTSEFSTYSLGIGQSVKGAGTIDAGGTGTFQVFSDNVVTPGDDSTGTLAIDGNLTLNGVEGTTPTGSLQFQLSDTVAGSNDQIDVSGNLVSNAGGVGQQTAISIIPVGSSLQSGGSYEVIKFGGNHTGSAADFKLNDSLQTRFTQSISVDSDSVNVDITGSNASLIWRGNDGTNPTNWDVNTTSNWSNGGGADNFFDLDNVTFDDTAVGTTAEVQGTVTPASVNFASNSKDITVGGTGEIAGGGTVTKSGTGRVTVESANSYSGETVITAGVLHAANDAALGSTAGGTTVNGGTLDITGTNIGSEVVSIQGAGSDGRGALITDGLDSLGGGARQLSNVVQTGDATIGAYSDQPVGSVFAANDYRWDLEPPSNAPDMDASWIGNGHTLTKKGRGTVSIQRVGDMGGGDINIEQGILFWQGSTTSAGATVTIGDNVTPHVGGTVATGSAELNTFFSGGTGPASSNGDYAIDLVLQGGAFAHATFGLAQDVAITGTVTNNDVTGDNVIDNRISAAGGKVTITNGITGNGDIEFGGNEEGTIELQANNTYTGVTSITGVTVALTGSAELSGSPIITISNDGTVDSAGRTDGTITANGQTVDLASASAVVGNLATSGNSTVKVFGDGSASSGQATVQLTPTQDRRLRYNPNSSQDAAGNQPGGQLFVGTISTNAGANGNDDLTRSVVEFDLTSNANLVGVTDIDSVSLVLNKNTVDGGSASDDVTLEVHELLQDFVFDEVTPALASAGTPWTGYTLDGDVDACVGAACALGSLVSTSVGSPANPLAVEFTDNQGGQFETLVEGALAGDGSVKLLLKADAAGEAVAQRALFRFGDFAGGDASVLEITFSGTLAEVGTAQIDGDFTLDATSTLELDIFSTMQSDLLDVTGVATLAGDIDANLLASSPLSVNDQITVLTTTGGITDSGFSINGPFSHSIIGNDLVLTFLGGLLGDFDGSGTVDGADFLLWQTNPTVGNLADWKANYGATNAVVSNSAVPEPSSMLLLVSGTGLFFARRKRS